MFKNPFVKIAVVFLTITLLSPILIKYYGIEFSNRTYWDHHGVFLLLFLAIFPRLTLLFSSIVSGGIFWWASFIFCPRLLIATLATISYWEQNPLLVLLSWLVAFGGESSEKYFVTNRNFSVRIHRGGGFSSHHETSAPKVDDPDTIEAEFKRK